MPGVSSDRVVILTPGGRDAEIAAKLLNEAGLASVAVKDISAMLDELHAGSGVALVADEVFRQSDIKPLVTWLEQQPPWSDFPFIALVSRGAGLERNPAAARLAAILGNVSFLEKPFHPTTLISLMRAALRGRRRQYEARSRLEELGEGQRQLRNALTAGNLGSWSLDVATMNLRASQTCKRHFGRLLDDDFGYEELASSIHPDDAERMQAAVAHTLATGQDYIIEYRNIWPDGSMHWVDVRARVIRNESGLIEQLVGVSSDITARKNSDIDRERLLGELARERAALSELTETLERRVVERTNELKAEVTARERAQDQLLQSQKMEGLGQLTGGVAHDFNNLLAAVMGNLDLLRKRIPDDPRMRRYIDGALQGAKRGAALTQRMLSFARQQELKTESADLCGLIFGIKDLLDRSLGPQIELILHLPAELPPAKVDSNQIELAILNLAVNARDAMPQGGTITITAGLEAESNQLFVKVSDTGTGMDDETLRKAVEPFFSTKAVGKGTGLGLSMVDGLAVQLGGKFVLASRLGEGTTATLLLPVADEVLPLPMPPEQDPVALESAAATILFVDDDPLISSSAVDMLEDLGHTVIEANSAKRALEILHEGRQIDLLMTDQAMPGMTGMELARQVRTKWPAMPILLATGYAELSEEEGYELPRLSKPYLQADLRKQIERLLTRR